MASPPEASGSVRSPESPIQPHDPEAFNREVAEALSHDLATVLGRVRSMPRYALIDGSLCPKGWLDAWCNEQGLDAEPLFLRTPEAALHPRGPHLIELPNAPMGRAHSLIKTLAEGPGVWQALTLTASPLPIMKLHAHLRAFLGGILEDKTEALLRWYDARVGIPMLQILPAAAQTAFMQPFAFWQSWDWNYQPIELKGEKQQSLPDYPTPVPIGEETLKALSGLNVVQGLIARFEEDPPQQDLDVSPLPMTSALKHYIAERELGEAQNLGLTKTLINQKAILWFAFHVHPDIWRHAHMREEAKKRFAKLGTMTWLFQEHTLRQRGEQALAEMGAAFIARLKTRCRTADPHPDGASGIITRPL
ncbi:hypothetical protein AGMMS50289_21750 [Betaproteobacteria bacterium]|nr:hypothetical protein AGMMS50289_21750 [Betaproteobacteria bacterium]